MLYLGTKVLILLDLSYVSRFWTQCEAWLSMQFATPNGLKSAIGTPNERHHIKCVQNATGGYAKLLVDNWSTKTPQQAFEFLSKPDVTVTNQSDKESQLPKIKELGETVKRAFKAIEVQLQERVRASGEAETRAKAALEAFEVENGAKAHDSQPLKAAAVHAEREAAAARAATEKHQQAIAHSVTPVVMEREEGQRIVERDAAVQILQRCTADLQHVSTRGCCGLGSLNSPKLGAAVANLREAIEAVAAIDGAESDQVLEAKQELENGCARCSVNEAKKAGYSLEEMKAVNKVGGLKQAGFSCAEVRQAGYTCAEATQAGYMCSEVK